jgi:hypothetical protein
MVLDVLFRCTCVFDGLEVEYFLDLNRLKMDLDDLEESLLLGDMDNTFLMFLIVVFCCTRVFDESTF